MLDLEADTEEVVEVKVEVDPEAGKKAIEWTKALGGSDNIKELTPCAVTRLRAVVGDPAKVNKMRLESEGVQAVMALPKNTYHLIVGPASDQYAREMRRVED